MPYKEVANSLQGTVRLLVRLGGKSKKTPTDIQYIETIKVVEKPVEVIKETIVEVPMGQDTKKIYEIFDAVNFDFDSDHLTPEAEKALDEIADILKKETLNKFLITGYTDAKGSPEYNLGLSTKRANKVVNRLVEKGVPKQMLKSRGVGSQISIVKPQSPNNIREGDRKITIELISNNDYWNYIP